MITQKEFRAFFDVAGQRIFFNHAAYAPLSRPVVNAMDEYFEHRRNGNPATWDIAVEHMEGLRQNYSRLIGAPVGRIGLMANTVTGINILATGLSWQAGDHILLYADEFPSNVMPFLGLRDRGVEVEFVAGKDGKVTPGLFEAAIRPSTRLISLSSIQYLTGYQADVKAFSELCHKHNIIFSVDAIQSLGVIPTDVLELGIDFMAVGGHKWMMSPLGTGFIYLTEELQSKLKLTYRGYMGHLDPVDFGNFEQDLSPDARRFELGAFNAPSMVGAEKATELLLDCGINSIYMHVHNLLNQFEYGLEESNYSKMYDFDKNEIGSIFVFSHKDKASNERIYEGLTAAGVNLSLRGGGLRIAPHYYNTPEEVEQVLSIMNDLG
ncbi:aminotransferase class V-fold PLP-dependent enzyme [bacterium]|nr:aminotransferase class V-fold PLP-dependent enzyme [bacterium]